MSKPRKSNSNIELTADQVSKLNLLKEQFSTADALAKEVENFVEEAGIPALNEMRYAGYHLISAIQIDECAMCSDQLTSSINHCKRACYEAAEAGVVVALLKFDEFQTSYKHVVIGEVLEDWIEIQTMFRTSREDVNTARAKGDDRRNDYEIQMRNFRELKKLCARMDGARDDLNTKIQAETKSSQRFIITSLIAVLGIFIAAALTVVGWRATANKSEKNLNEKPSVEQADTLNKIQETTGGE